MDQHSYVEDEMSHNTKNFLTISNSTYFKAYVYEIHTCKDSVLLEVIVLKWKYDKL